MKRILKIAAMTMAVLLAAACAVFACMYGASQRRQVEIRHVKAVVADSASAGGGLSAQTVQQWVAASGVQIAGRSIDEVDIRKIGQSIRSRSIVRQAQVYSDLEGTLWVRVRQRRPAVRVCTETGYDFYLSEDGYVMPASGVSARYLPVVTGNAVFPFRPGVYGKYEELIAGYKADFADSFRQLLEAKQEQKTVLAGTEALRHEIRGSRPMFYKLWGSARKDEFNRRRDHEIAAADEKIAECRRRIDELDRKMAAEVEKQKKSQKSYEFLPKLLTFVKTVSEDDFWNSQIVQINLLSTGSGDEPEVEIIPRAGAHVVRLGRLENIAAKLDKLLLFYRGVLDYQGWNSCRYIDLRFDNQIVCTK